MAFRRSSKGLSYAILSRATTNYFPRQNRKINLGEWQENLRVISPGGVSPLRLIPDSLLRRTIPHLHLRERRGEEKTVRGEDGGGEEKAPESNMRQHRNVPNIRRSSSSPFPTPKTYAAVIEDIRSHAGMQWTTRCQIHGLWWQSFPSGKHRFAEMDRVSRARETDISKLALIFKRKMTYIRILKVSTKE